MDTLYMVCRHYLGGYWIRWINVTSHLVSWPINTTVHTPYSTRGRPIRMHQASNRTSPVLMYSCPHSATTTLSSSPSPSGTRESSRFGRRTIKVFMSLSTCAYGINAPCALITLVVFLFICEDMATFLKTCWASVMMYLLLLLCCKNVSYVKKTGNKAVTKFPKRTQNERGDVSLGLPTSGSKS